MEAKTIPRSAINYRLWSKINEFWHLLWSEMYEFSRYKYVLIIFQNILLLRGFSTMSSFKKKLGSGKGVILTNHPLINVINFLKGCEKPQNFIYFGLEGVEWLGLSGGCYTWRNLFSLVRHLVVSPEINVTLKAPGHGKLITYIKR